MRSVSSFDDVSDACVVVLLAFVFVIELVVLFAVFVGVVMLLLLLFGEDVMESLVETERGGSDLELFLFFFLLLLLLALDVVLDDDDNDE